MRKKDFCPDCGSRLLSVIKPKMNGNGNVAGSKKVVYCPDCKKKFTVDELTFFY